MAKSHRRYFEELRRAAQANEASAPRKHHLVPASYLSRWEFSGLLWVCDLTTRRSYKTSAAQAARETDFYRVEDDQNDPKEPPPLLFETMLSRIEGACIPGIDLLVTDGADALGAADRFNVTLFIAFQLARGRRFRAEMQQMTHGMFKATLGSVSTSEAVRARHGNDLSEAEVVDFLKGYEMIRTGELVVGRSKAAQVMQTGESAVEMGEFLFSRDWVVYETQIDLETTDEPVVLVGGRHFPRGTRSGVGVAGVVLFPLAPWRLLAMFDPSLHLSGEALIPILTAAETAEVNLELLSAAHRWRISSGFTPRAPFVPALPPPIPYAIVERAVAVVNEPGAEILHTFPPSRWLFAPNQPLPVERWWTHDEREPVGGLGRTPWVPASGLYLTDEALNRRREGGKSRV